MNWNASTVPVSVEERHELSILLGKAFAQAYKIHPFAEDTEQILEIYRAARRMVDMDTTKRYGSLDAYNATQGF